MTAIVAVVLAAAVWKSPGQPAGEAAGSGVGSVSNSASADPSVDLLPNQLDAVKIGELGTYLFPVEKEAPGSISFEKDPAEIQAESTLLGAAGTAEVTSNELVRARALYETNGVSQRELEQAVSDDQTAQAALLSARSAVLVLGVSSEEVDRVLAAKRIGAPPAPKSDSKWVLAEALESDSPSLRVGQAVRVRAGALPGKAFNGKISRIYTVIDPNLHRQPIRCEVDDPGGDLRIGMLVEVAIQVAEPVESIAVPLNGVVREGDGTMTVWVTTDRKHFTQRIIKIGMREDGKVQVLDGLKDDKLVVTDGAVFLDNMINAVPSD